MLVFSVSFLVFCRFTFNVSLFTSYVSLLTFHFSLLTSHVSPFTFPVSLLSLHKIAINGSISTG